MSGKEGLRGWEAALGILHLVVYKSVEVEVGTGCSPLPLAMFSSVGTLHCLCTLDLPYPQTCLE